MKTYNEKYEEMSLKINVKGDGSYDGDFTTEVEDLFGISDWPNIIKLQIHNKAWVDGHSSGYFEVINQYHDLVDLVRLCEKELVKGRVISPTKTTDGSEDTIEKFKIELLILQYEHEIIVHKTLALGVENYIVDTLVETLTRVISDLRRIMDGVSA